MFAGRYFGARFFAPRYFPKLGAGAPAAAADPYAWFPGDRGPAPPTLARRYEEYAKEPRKRRRGPRRIPKALQAQLDAATVTPPPLEVGAPIAPPQPLELPPPLQTSATPASKHPEGAKKVLPEVYPVPIGAEDRPPADWTAYAHLPPLSAEEEAEELMVLAQFTRGKRR